MSEADLKGHLSNPKGGEQEKQKPATKPSVKIEKSDKDKNSNVNLAKKDYPLYEALNVLKSMSLIQSRK